MTKRQGLSERVAQLRREKAARERRDISQKEVAKEVGVSRPVISETESGKTYPSPATLAKLAKYFAVSEMFLEYGNTGGGPLDQIAKEEERPASELLKQQTPATRASAKKKRTG